MSTMLPHEKYTGAKILTGPEARLSILLSLKFLVFQLGLIGLG